MARWRNGLGYASGQWFKTWPGQLAGLAGNPAQGATGFWSAPWEAPSLNPRDYAQAGSGGSHDFPVGGYPVDYALYPPPGTGGSRVGSGFHGLGACDPATQSCPDDYSYYGGMGDQLCTDGMEYHPGVGCVAPAPASSAIKVTTEGAASILQYFQSKVFGLPAWAVWAVGLAVAYKMTRRR